MSDIVDDYGWSVGVNLADVHGKTAMIWASKEGHHSVVRLLPLV